MSSKTVSSKVSTSNQIPLAIADSTERPVEELLNENAALRTALEARTQENILLNEVISTVGSTLKLDEVLHHLVETVARATSCHAALFTSMTKRKNA